jgi:hypothetical protein
MLKEPDSTFEELDAAAPALVPADPAQPAAPPPAGIQINSEADLAALRSLADMGITPNTADGFVQAKAQLESMRTALSTDPDVVLAQLEAANSDAYFKLLDKATERYLRHFPAPKEGETAAGSKGSVAQSDPAITSQLTVLQSEINALKADKSNAAQAANAKVVEAEYNTRVDALVADAGAKAKLDADQRELLKFRVNASISHDPAARRRIMQGVYADIPTHFKGVLDAKATETKAASATGTAARAAVAAGGRTEPTAGAAASDGAPVSGNPADEWDSAADAFASGLVAAQPR